MFSQVTATMMQLLHSDLVLTVLLAVLSGVFEFARRISKETFMYWIFLAVELIFWFALASMIIHDLQKMINAIKSILTP